MKHLDKLNLIKLAFIQPEEEPGLDWGWGMLGTPAVQQGVGLGQKAYLDKTGLMNLRELDKQDKRLYRDLLGRAKETGVNISTPETSSLYNKYKNQAAGIGPDSGWMDKLKRMRSELIQKGIAGNPAFYDPEHHEVSMKSYAGRKATPDTVVGGTVHRGIGGEIRTPKFVFEGSPATPARHLDPGILAHELGHSQSPKWLLNKYLIGAGKLSPFAMLPTMYSDDKDFAGTAAALGTAASVPMMASELDASWRGGKMLEELGATGWRNKLRAFKGIPTYAAMAALPALGYGIKNLFGGYDS